MEGKYLLERDKFDLKDYLDTRLRAHVFLQTTEAFLRQSDHPYGHSLAKGSDLELHLLGSGGSPVFISPAIFSFIMDADFC